MISPSLLANAVDRYLSDNNFLITRSNFHHEASSLLVNNEAERSSLSLLDEYICLSELKESMYQERDECRKQKTLLYQEKLLLYQYKKLLHQERVALMQEKNRIQSLFQDIQNLINNYNSLQRLTPPNVTVMNANSAMVPQPGACPATRSGVSPVTTTTLPPQNVSHMQSLPMRMEAGNLFAPIISEFDRKRQDSEAVDVPSVSKKRRGRPPGRKNNVQGKNTLPSSSNAVNKQVVSTPWSAIQSCAFDGSHVQGSSVANNLLNPPSFPIPTNSLVPNTPRKTNPSLEISHVKTCNGETAEQLTCITRNLYISPINGDLHKTSNTDHVSSSLDASDMHQNVDNSLSNVVAATKFDMEDLADISDLDTDV
ncbi:hypothetical protein Fmac_012299 [Flemingia macrophylla]|uniref:Uncharacterized protein n=1 Tax=Flemingia macrophylla TaxID=520843 RepID=A0ABD1MPY7_9FABA